MGLYAAKNAVLRAAQLKLGAPAARLLVFMALECWDDEDNPANQTPRRYFGRREASAIALGYLAPANGTDAAFSSVKRAIRELVTAGAISRIRQGGNGRPAEFELQLDSSRPGHPNPNRNGLVLVPRIADQRGTQRPPRGIA